MGVDRALRRRVGRLGEARPRQASCRVRAGNRRRRVSAGRRRRRSALGQLARSSAGGVKRLFGGAAAAAAARGGGRRERRQRRRNRARFVDVGDLVFQPAEPADQPLENVLDVAEPRLGALVGIFLFGAQLGQTVGQAADLRRRLHRPPRRVELFDQVVDPPLEVGAWSRAIAERRGDRESPRSGRPALRRRPRRQAGAGRAARRSGRRLLRRT